MSLAIARPRGPIHRPSRPALVARLGPALRRYAFALAEADRRHSHLTEERLSRVSCELLNQINDVLRAGR